MILQKEIEIHTVSPSSEATKTLKEQLTVLGANVSNKDDTLMKYYDDVTDIRFYLPEDTN